MTAVLLFHRQAEAVCRRVPENCLYILQKTKKNEHYRCKKKHSAPRTSEKKCQQKFCEGICNRKRRTEFARKMKQKTAGKLEDWSARQRSTWVWTLDLVGPVHHYQYYLILVVVTYEYAVPYGIPRL